MQSLRTWLGGKVGLSMCRWALGMGLEAPLVELGHRELHVKSQNDHFGANPCSWHINGELLNIETRSARASTKIQAWVATRPLASQC